MTTGIYKITNQINGKMYIGQSVHIERRWQEHCRPSTASVISKAIKKYGVQNFTFDIIEECEEKDLNKRESYWINEYQSLIPNGYNISDVTESNHSSYVYFSKQDLYKIIDDLKNTELSLVDIANKYSVNVSTISRINTGSIHHLDNIIYPVRNTNWTSQITFCIDCGKQITNKSIRCNPCAGKYKTIMPPVQRDKLKSLIRSTPFTTIAKQFQVSDNSIRKWCDKYNLPRKSSDIKKYNDAEWEAL